MFKTRFISMLVLLITAVSGAWAGSKPTGYFDICTAHHGSIRVKGWAYDPDQSSVSIQVHAYIWYGSTVGTSKDQRMPAVGINTDVERSDVNSAKGITGLHGFDRYITVPAGTYTVEIFAIDKTGDGNPKLPVTGTQSTHITVTVTGDPYNITYDANGGSDAPDAQQKGEFVQINLSAGVPTREGYTFKEWNTAQDGSGDSYASGATYTADGDATLYAQWTAPAPAGYTVSMPQDTPDAGKWTARAGTDGIYQQLPLEGVAAGTAVSLKYGGALKVKSVKAKKKAAANVAVTSITLNKTATEITVGQTETLSVTSVLPEEATDPTYTWKTSDETKATVDQDGKVTAVAAGTVNIYAEANDGSGVQGTCAVTVKVAPTLANTLTNAGMTVKVNFNYSDDKDVESENYCQFLSNGDGNYTFQSGGGWVGGGSRCAKALVVEDDKLVFKVNYWGDIDQWWDSHGFSVTFDTGNNTYIQYKGSTIRKYSSLISVEVNNQPINNSLTERKITVDDLDTEGCEYWDEILPKNSDLIYAEDHDCIRRMTDDAKLMASEDGGNSWYEVYWNDPWDPDWKEFMTYKFEVVDETGD